MNASDKEIYERDLGWLHSSDVVIAEVSTPSLGVGYELAVAEKLGKRILCLFRPGKGKHLSAMIAGNGHFEIREYGTVGEAQNHIDRFLNGA